MKTKFGPDVKIIVSVINRNYWPTAKKAIGTEGQKYLKNQFELADTIPTHFETYNLGLLIGNDYYRKNKNSRKPLFAEIKCWMDSIRKDSTRNRQTK